MAKKKGGAKTKDKSGKTKGKKVSNKLANVYEISGESITRKNKSCPKCGVGTFLANHKDRSSCGKCGYMEKK